MKTNLSTILSAVVCFVLIAAAVSIGAVRGWSSDRNEVLSALTADGGMHELLETRAMDAANLAVVAARHLPGADEDLAALRSASTLMLSGTAAPDQLMLADDTVTDVALRFADELPALASVQASKRDKAYVSILTGTLGKKTGLSHNYELMVQDFNQRLNASLTGKLAMLLGVSPLPAVNAE